MKMQTSFKEDLRKSLINHALIPFVCAIFVIIMVLTVIGLGMICQRCKETGKEFTVEYTELMETYESEIEEISRSFSVSDFQNDMAYRVRELEDIYHFLNQQEVRGEFYLFDADFKLVYGTSRDTVAEEYLENHLRSNRNDDEFWNKTEFIYDNWNLRRESYPYCLIFRKITPEMEDGQIGYGGFMISASRFQLSQPDQNLTLIITNRFRRVFSEGAGKFCNDRGKLGEDFSGNGLFTMNHRWYYASSNETSDGEVYIFAVADSTEFFQIALLSSAILLLMSVILIYFIYVSAGNIATRKTEIMYELVDVLKEVEQGNLDVKLEIRSGDEFETIGHTFNMMLESIRNLILRQQQLTKENAVATMQALESQFNPHFLFNSLEAVRYMIQLDAVAAEKMVVNLSKLLRYSIQNGEKMVILGEELEFADKYLQIMLYRYGDRLTYSIEVDDWMYEVETPRMILQPIIENSIKYGYGDRETLNICISSHTREQGVEIVVEDDGIGIEEKLLEEIQENLKHNHNYTEHIGIHNVHRRLRLLYGEEYGVMVESRAGYGTKIKLYMPDLENLGGIECAESTDC